MDDDDFISKTRRKKQMTALQDLGAELVKLSPELLARIEMPQELREAILACKRFSKHEAVRRQKQYIGKIMRDIDADPIARQLEAMQAPSRIQTALFHRAEQWRGEIMASDESIARFAHEFPEADPHRLRALAASARSEQGSGKAPKDYRELFHAINKILQDHGRRK